MNHFRGKFGMGMGVQLLAQKTVVLDTDELVGKVK